MQNTAQPYLAYRISGRPLDLGLIGFAATLPTLLLALPAGVLVSTDITTDGVNATREDVIAARDSVPNDTDLINSPTAGTCYMCHDSNPAAAHFGQMGGVIDAERAGALGE